MEDKTIGSSWNVKSYVECLDYQGEKTHGVGADQEGCVGSLVLVVAGVMDDAFPGKRERLEGHTEYTQLCRFTASR